MKTFLFTASFLTVIAFKPSVAQIIEEQSENTPSNFTSIEFETTSYDFGDVEEGEIVKHIYKFTNTGNYPLVISGAQGSCGCTVPFYPKTPILPGESSEIQVTFDSKGRMGLNHKTVTITANTHPEVSVLKLQGIINPAKEPTGESEEERAKRQEEKEAMEALSPNCFAIYPNPTNNELQLDLKEYIGLSANVQISDKLGQTILKTSIDKISSESTVFDVSSYKPGMYLITITIEGQKTMAQCFVVTGS